MSKKPKETEYLDPEGKPQKGWALEGHVYQDEAATAPVPVGSTVHADNGRYYRMTPYGGVLWAAPQQTAGSRWIPQGNPWYRAAQDAAYALAHRPGFSYDPQQDPLYRGAKDQYLLQGRRAMEDTLGRVAGLTGGYASTYAQTLGTQAYQDQITRLAQLLPDYYDRAREAYDREGQALQDSLGQAIGLYDRDYQTWLDKQAALERKTAADREEAHWAARQEQWAQEFGEDRRRWEAEEAEDRRRYDAKTQEDRRRWDAEAEEARNRWALETQEDRRRWELEFSQALRKYEAELRDREAREAASADASERSYAYRMAMLALQQGLQVTDDLLQTAGIDKTYAEALRRYYASLRP